ncbi:phosphoglycerate mutase (2,3-diphosphoglycerate-independent) [Candidatus Saccharibacteria bacterium]|nr:phosphoglycerate mutase (2,3-diphosphoglycerate-independent) [Candidatus Saccharibacteria bacterium]
MDKLQFDGPVVLAILDGVGLAPDGVGNAVSKARTPFLGSVARNYLHVALNASGEAVGLTPGQMGNSEVGHNTMGAGRAYRQGIAQINEAFKTGEVFNSKAWQGAISRVLGEKNRGNIDKDGEMWYNREVSPATLHFAGIFSDGGVHSDIAHLEQMIERAYAEGVRKMRVHAIFDGRDVAPQSEPRYIQRFESFVARFPDADIKIASGGGRQTTVADRYQDDWQVVARGWDMMVNGQADFYFKTPVEAIQILRRIDPEVQDQNLPAFVIVDENEEPVGRVQKGDALIYFDFRADRAIEIAMAFTYWDFPYFNRGDYQPTDVYFVGMTEYNSDTHVPEHRLVEPVKLDKTLSQFLDEREISQLAVTETVKFGHITYYFNGNSYEKGNKEEFVQIDTYDGPHEVRPWMRSADIADAVIAGMDEFKFIRLNFPGGDMVGHTANIEATVVAMEAIDLALARIAVEVDKRGGALVIIADHGNAEELLDANGKPKTSHTTNPVPFIIYDNTVNREKYRLAELFAPSLANLAATMAMLLGQNDYPVSWERPLISVN